MFDDIFATNVGDFMNDKFSNIPFPDRIKIANDTLFFKRDNKYIAYIDTPGISKVKFFMDRKCREGYYYTLTGENTIDDKHFKLNRTVFIAASIMAEAKEISVKTVFGVTIISVTMETKEENIPKITIY